MISLSELRNEEEKRLLKEPEVIVDRKKKKFRHKMIDIVLV